ncbi:hypothetical protein QYM36_002812 [Artemia franciscana]|uniref:Uncharacterized protein n=1 Tax=Artemia franciscana TaxID=6661 RepID=A0AA88L9S8_ARTSF|nr:hypothetical protein QYM36_002812 [Artemia franciscana]
MKIFNHIGMTHFVRDDQLRNIANGITSSQDANVDEADVAGKVILNKMTGKTMKEYVIEKKKKVTLMNATKAESSVVAHTDPAFLFQRFIIVAPRTDIREKYFKNDFLHEKVKASFVQIEQSTSLEAAWQKFGSQSLAFFHSEGDKDVLIAEKAAEAARVTDTIMIADNTDILALLIS